MEWTTYSTEKFLSWFIKPKWDVWSKIELKGSLFLLYLSRELTFFLYLSLLSSESKLSYNYLVFVNLFDGLVQY